MWRSSSIRCLSRVIGETSCTDENIEIRQPAGLRVTRSAVPAPIEKLLRGRKSAQNAACGLVQQYLCSVGACPPPSLFRLAKPSPQPDYPEFGRDRFFGRREVPQMCYRKGFFIGFAIAGLSALAVPATAQGQGPGQPAA